MTLVLVALAFSFAWSIGSHYTGACMGMPYALGAVSANVCASSRPATIPTIFST